MNRKPRTIDEYLAPLSEEKRAALEKLRATIRAAAPRAEETITYNLPAFRLDGRALVAFGAAARHCSLYPMSARTIEVFADELAGFELSRGTIRFAPDRPIPATLVKKLVRARIVENREKAAAASTRKKARS